MVTDGERLSRKSVLSACLDYIYIYIYKNYEDLNFLYIYTHIYIHEYKNYIHMHKNCIYIYIYIYILDILGRILKWNQTDVIKMVDWFSCQLVATLKHLNFKRKLFGHQILARWLEWGRPGFNPRSSHTKDSKMVLDASLLNTQHYKVGVKWSNPGNGVAPSPTPWCSSYWKGSLRVTLAYGRQFKYH